MGHETKIRGSIGQVNAIMYNNNNVYVGADKRGDNYGKILHK